MRIQDLFQAINVREIMLELDVRRVGDKSHVTEMSSVFRSLHVARDVCILLDLEQDDPVTSVAMLAQARHVYCQYELCLMFLKCPTLYLFPSQLVFGLGTVD